MLFAYSANFCSVPGAFQLTNRSRPREFGSSFLHEGKVLTVFLVHRQIASEADHEIAKEEAVQKLREVLAGLDMI
jgi:hypothetical protein